MIKGAAEDPKGLIYEAYRIEGIGKSECRSIFLDWAMSLPPERDTDAALRILMAQYGASAPEHPMTQVILEGLAGMSAPRRRGGWRGRSRN